MAANEAKRVAQCGCGGLTATVTGDPVTVYVCSCLACQRKSGSSFTYAALFPSAAVTIGGERKTWRHTGDSGRWIENIFCPTCGITVGFLSEGMPGLTGVPAGCFADPDFAPPATLYTGDPAVIDGSASRPDWTCRTPRTGNKAGDNWFTLATGLQLFGPYPRYRPAPN